MTSSSIVSLGNLAVLACSAWAVLSPSAQAQVADPCDGLKELGLFVNGEPVDEYVARVRGTDEVQTLLEELEITVSRQRLTAILIQLDDNPQAEMDDLPDALQGIAGLTTSILLKKLLPRTEEAPEEPIADEIVYGRIRDHTYLKSDMSGHLSVDICTDRKEFVPLGGSDLRKFFHWDVEIPEGEYSVATRVDPSDPSDPAQYDNPFPMVNLPLPAMAVDPADPRSVWRRGLDHKLHAEGAGIVVRRVYFRKLSEPDLTLFPDTHHYYDSTEASCVDLFTVGEPPATFGELAGNDYCLGRCQHPAIYNSGD